MALGKDIDRLSDGRATYDARRKRLTMRDEAGVVVVDLQVTEAALRNALQRLLLTGPPQSGVEPQEAAVLLLLKRMEKARSTTARPTTLASLVD